MKRIKRFNERLLENESKIIVTNLFVEIGVKEVSIPDFYFK